MTNMKDFSEMVKGLEEQVEKMDFNNNPTIEFRIALIEKLIEKDFDSKAAAKIAAKMTVELAWFDKNNEDWQKILDSYSNMIILIDKKLNTVQHSELVKNFKEEMAAQLSIKCDMPAPVKRPGAKI